MAEMEGLLTTSCDNGMPTKAVAVGKEIELGPGLGFGVNRLSCSTRGVEEGNKKLSDHIGGVKQSRPVGK